MNLDNTFTRRHFLQSSLAVISAAATMPAFLQNTAYASDERLGKPGNPDERILVVVQLGGGNDGLNTLVPYTNDDYHRVRRGLSLREKDIIKLGKNGDYGLHSAMKGFAELYDEGSLSIVQGVGYPNPNRSHFRSMDIWHTANTSGQGTGWLGRYLDAECAGNPQADLCIAVAKKAPLAAQGSTIQPVSFENASQFRWVGDQLHDDLKKGYEDINNTGVIGQPAPDSAEAFLMRTAMDARVSSDKIRKAAAAQSLVAYPNSKLAQKLKLVGAMIRSNLPTRVYYTSMGGFDTHAGQLNRHRNLLTEASSSITAFYRDLKKQGNADRVTIMVFSEFGRRVKPNASQGTDHGTAAPMFLIGPQLTPGLQGQYPSLTELDKNGDLVHTTDFRSVYAGVLDHWLKADSNKVLRAQYPAMDLFKAKVKA